MASTISLQSSINWAKPFLFFKPLNIGVNNEPAISSANLIQQTIVSQPFRWPWNRAIKSFTCLQQGAPPATQQDYSVYIPDFGFLERATIVNPVASPNGAIMPAPIFELEIRNGLSEDAAVGKPNYISFQADDNNGNIIFRLMPIPDQEYVINLSYQKKIPLMKDLSTLWSVPDNYSHLYQYGFMSLMMQYSDDPRWQVYNAKFVTHLLASAQGLTEMERNIFEKSWQSITGFPQSKSIELQQAWQSRGNL
jgi:hypothetical protein